ncbi:MAG: hypothetical protein HC787_08585 [Nostocaceae cyanobacterium CSU_2_110]|nr:hypothetical protein [Nostocaceae cyanobacterium CSU_2_110]
MLSIVTVTGNLIAEGSKINLSLPLSSALSAPLRFYVSSNAKRVIAEGFKKRVYSKRLFNSVSSKDSG